MNFDFGFTLEILPQLLEGLGVTVLATLGGMVVALLLGGLWALLRRSERWWLSAPASLSVQFLRNTPLLIQLYFVFYVLPELGLSLPPLACGIIGLGVQYSAYFAEIYRAGIEGVASGQWEAAKALDVGPATTFTRIVLPQAMRASLPAIGNRFIGMFKDSALLAAITVAELLQRAKEIGSDTFRYLEPMTLVGLLFLAVTLVASRSLTLLERRLEL